MDSLYSPEGVEERWQRTWEEEGLYNAEAGPARRELRDRVPPPNVTGELHMGHALNARSRTRSIRWHRMQGFNVLFQPGYDHAGISTQNVVEKELAQEGNHARISAARRSSSASGSGSTSTAARSCSSSAGSAPRSTTAASGSRWTTAYVRAVMRFFVHL